MLFKTLPVFARHIHIMFYVYVLSCFLRKCVNAHTVVYHFTLSWLIGNEIQILCYPLLRLFSPLLSCRIGTMLYFYKLHIKPIRCITTLTDVLVIYNLNKQTNRGWFLMLPIHFLWSFVLKWDHIWHILMYNLVTEKQVFT